jgi:hypothetical protein
VALGADGEEPEPGLREVGRAAGIDVHASTKEGKEAYVEPVIEDGGTGSR